MATALAHHSLLYFLSLLFSISLLNHSSAAATITTNAKAGYRLQLIHRDSPLCPFYNPNATLFDRANNSFRRDIARMDYIRSVLQPHSFNPKSIQGPVTVAEGIYLLKMQIGNLPYQFFANVDTGSDLIWIQCLPCTDCFEQNDPIYDPSQSSTQATIDCKSPQCLATQEHECGATNECLYTVVYADGSYTSGVLAKEAFTFQSLDAGPPNVTFRDIAFGCGHNNSGLFSRNETGIVGFSRGQLSLVNQLGSAVSFKFSHCFVPHTDLTVGSQLILGERAVIGASAPLISLSGSANKFYYLNVTGITVGTEDLLLPPGFFDPTWDNNGGFVIDSGSTVTMLATEAYKLLLKSMMGQISLPVIDEPYGDFDLCYNASYSQVLQFPVITFHFAEGLNVPLFPQYTFEFGDDNQVCLGVIESPSGGFPSIFGLGFQQNMNIGYDLQNGRISFAPTDCATFETGG